jgi:hypothetical protein
LSQSIYNNIIATGINDQIKVKSQWALEVIVQHINAAINPGIKNAIIVKTVQHNVIAHIIGNVSLKTILIKMFIIYFFSSMFLSF